MQALSVPPAAGGVGVSLAHAEQTCNFSWSDAIVPAIEKESNPMSADARRVTIAVDGTRSVSGLLVAPPRAHVLAYVFAHGAGAGMAHPFMEAVAAELGERGIATLRHQFPATEQGGKGPDLPKLAHATVRAAVAEAARLLPDLPLIAGESQILRRPHDVAGASLHAPLPRVCGGLAFPRLSAPRPRQAPRMSAPRISSTSRVPDAFPARGPVTSSPRLHSSSR